MIDHPSYLRLLIIPLPLQIDKSRTSFKFKLHDKTRAKGPERLKMGRKRDAAKFEVTEEVLREEQKSIVNRSQVDDDGVPVCKLHARSLL